MPAVAIPPAALKRAWNCLLGVRLRCRILLMGARRWPGLQSEMVTWFRALTDVHKYWLEVNHTFPDKEILALHVAKEANL